MPLVEFQPWFQEDKKPEGPKHTSAGWDWEAAKSNWLAGMGHLGGALLPGQMGQDATDYAQRMTALAQEERAQSTDPQSFSDVHSIGDLGNYAKQLAIGGAPMLGEMAGWAAAEGLSGGALTPALLTRMGLRGGAELLARPLAERAATAAYTGALKEGLAAGMSEEVAHAGAIQLAQEVAEQTTQSLLAKATLAGATVPSSMGTQLGAQYDTAGKYDLLSAGATAIPMAALNLAGPGGMLSGAKTMASGGIRAGLMGLGTEMGVMGGAGAGQAMLTQAARMGVDSNQSMVSPEALQSYGEGAVGGAVMGGMFGLAHIPASMRGVIDPVGARATDLLQQHQAAFQADKDARFNNFRQGFLARAETAPEDMGPYPSPVSEYARQRDLQNGQLTDDQAQKLAQVQEDMYAPPQFQQVETKQPALTPEQAAQLATVQAQLKGPMREALPGQTADMFRGGRGTDSGNEIPPQAPGSKGEMQNAIMTAQAHADQYRALADDLSTQQFENLVAMLQKSYDQHYGQSDLVAGTKFTDGTKLDNVTKTKDGVGEGPAAQVNTDGQLPLFDQRGKQAKAIEKGDRNASTEGNVPPPDAAENLRKQAEGAAHESVNEVPGDKSAEGHTPDEGVRTESPHGEGDSAEAKPAESGTDRSGEPGVQEGEVGREDYQNDDRQPAATHKDVANTVSYLKTAINQFHDITDKWQKRLLGNGEARTGLSDAIHAQAHAVMALMDTANHKGSRDVGNAENDSAASRATAQAAKSAQRALEKMKPLVHAEAWAEAERREALIQKRELATSKGGEGDLFSGKTDAELKAAANEKARAEGKATGLTAEDHERAKPYYEEATHGDETAPAWDTLPVEVKDRVTQTLYDSATRGKINRENFKAEVENTLEESNQGKDVRKLEAALEKAKEGRKSTADTVDEMNDGEYHEEDRDVLTAQDEGAFSRGDSGEKSTVEDVKAAAEKELEGKAGRPELNVVQSAKDLPFDAPDNAQGAIRKGVMHLVADNIAPGTELGDVVKHELVHHGLRGFFGESLDKALEFIHNVNPTIRKYAKEWVAKNQDVIKAQNLTPEQVRFKSIDEAMARMGQEGKVFNGARKLAAKIQGLLHSIGLESWAKKLESLTDAQAAEALHKAEMFVRDGTKLDASAHGDTTASFSRASDAALKPEAREALEEKVDRVVEKLPEPLQGPVRKIADTVSNALIGKGDRVLNTLFIGDAANAARPLLGKTVDDYVNAMHAKGTHVHELVTRVREHASNFRQLSADEQKSVDRVVNALDGKVAKLEDAPEFKALSEKAQAVTKEQFAIGHDFLKAERDAALKSAQEARDRDLANAKTEEAKQQIKDDYAAQEQRVSKQFRGSLDMLYSPKVRKGDYFMVAKSKAYRDAEARNDDKAMAEMMSDANHYVVKKGSRSEMRREANAYRADDRFREGGSANHFAQEDYINKSQHLFKVLKQVKASIENASEHAIPDSLKKHLASQLDKMYVQSLADSSARKANLRRRDVAGYMENRVSSSIEHYESMAHLIGTIEHNGKIESALASIKRAAKEGTVGSEEDRVRFANNFALRHALNTVHTNNGIQNALMRGTALMRVVTSPKFLMQQVSEPWMVMLPRLASEFEYGKSASAMKAAMAEAAEMMGSKNPLKSILMHNGELNLDNYVSPHGYAETVRMKEYLKYLMGRGRLDMTQMSQLNMAESGSKITATGKAVLNRLNQIATNSETVNRLTSALSAYRLAFEKELAAGKSETEAHQAAMERADELVRSTHGEFESWAAPPIMNQAYWNTKGVTIPVKLMAQFKKFELMRTTLMLGQIKKAFGERPEGVAEKEWADQKKMARQYLKYAYAHYGVMAGAMGLPGYGLASTVIDWIFGDSKTPTNPDFDTQQFFEKHLGKDAAGVLLHGVPSLFGLDLTNTFGAGSLGTGLIGHYDDFDMRSRNAVDQTVGRLAGPAVGLAGDYVDAIAKMRQGDYYKGLEMMMPTLIRNGMYVARMHSEGLTNAQNDVLLRPDQMTEFQKSARMFGLTESDMERRQVINNAVHEADDYYKTKFDRVAHEYRSAAAENDTAGVKAATEAWQELNKGAQAYGILPHPMSEMFKSRGEQIKRQAIAQTMGGIEASKRDRNFVRGEVAR